MKAVGRLRPSFSFLSFSLCFFWGGEGCQRVSASNSFIIGLVIHGSGYFVGAHFMRTYLEINILVNLKLLVV